MSTPAAASSSESQISSHSIPSTTKHGRVVSRRKARMNVFFREECEDRNLTGQAKLALEAEFVSFLEEHIAKTELVFASGNEGARIAEAFGVDSKAWEEFKAHSFPKLPLSTTFHFDFIVKPKGAKCIDVHEVHHTYTQTNDNTSSTNNTHNASIQNSTLLETPRTPNHFLSPLLPPARKREWKKESQCSLLKGVLVSNAIKIKLSSSSGNILEKELMSGRLICSSVA